MGDTVIPQSHKTAQHSTVLLRGWLPRPGLNKGAEHIRGEERASSDKVLLSLDSQRR